MLCLECHADLGNSHGLKKFCSVRCRLKCQVRRNKRIKKYCGDCGKEFLGIKRNKYCCQTCGARSRKEHIRLIHESRRKYKKIEGLTRGQIFLLNNPLKHAENLDRDIRKRCLLIKHLGSKCIKCGYDQDIRALQIDHIRGDGKQDRKRLGQKIQRYYIKNLQEATHNLQVLCANCHAIKTYIMEENTRKSVPSG